MVYGINREILIHVTLVFTVQVMDMTGKYISGIHGQQPTFSSFPPPNDRNPSWGKEKPKLDDDSLDDSMAGLRINNSDKQNMVDTGPPPFVPGQAWKGPVDHKDGKLDPYKNPDLTPGMADQLRNSKDFRAAPMVNSRIYSRK